MTPQEADLYGWLEEMAPFSDPSRPTVPERNTDPSLEEALVNFLADRAGPDLSIPSPATAAELLGLPEDEVEMAYLVLQATGFLGPSQVGGHLCMAPWVPVAARVDDDLLA